jgi:glycosyltransferase involved in cell wall biosynthesis
MIFSTIYYSFSTDYVLIDTYSTLNFWYAFIVSQICRIFNLKYITILHGGNLPARITKNPNCSDLIFKNAYRIIAPSGYLYDTFSKRYPKGIVEIPNAIEIHNYPFIERKYSIPKLLWVRSFSPIYNPKMAIQVLINLKNEFPNAELTMVGPDRNNYRKESELLATKHNLNVFFSGKLSQQEWISLSKSHNIFINTSNFDNMPVSVIEAMALGLPIISTNIGGIPYLLKDQEEALLVQVADSEAMYQAVVNLFSNQDFRKILIENARNKAEKFDWEVVKHQWFQILK